MAKARIITMVILLIALLARYEAEAQMCGADLMGLVSECLKYVDKSGPTVRPSQSCCSYVRPIDVPCACDYVSIVEAIVDMEKVVYVARSCEKSIPPGFKCGSYTVPGA